MVLTILYMYTLLYNAILIYFNQSTKTQSRKNQIQEINCIYQSVSTYPEFLNIQMHMHSRPFQKFTASTCFDICPFSVSLRIHLPCKTNQYLPIHFRLHLKCIFLASGRFGFTIFLILEKLLLYTGD